jgi:hypothetical protein
MGGRPTSFKCRHPEALLSGSDYVAQRWDVIVVAESENNRHWLSYKPLHAILGQHCELYSRSAGSRFKSNRTTTNFQLNSVCEISQPLFAKFRGILRYY